ncbi:MAG TPA: phage holin family protein [Candidatus Saccharimonadales bacterium]|nr:phage holin family protein [Candidatus Saccharimonadales bacterium]
MDNAPHAEGGLLSTLTRMFKTVRDVVENRVELFLLELREERLRLMELLLLLLAGTVCALMALLMITFVVVVFFWDTHRLLVIALIIAAYAGAATIAFGMLRSRLRRWRAFVATLEQIKKDQECFKEKS